MRICREGDCTVSSSVRPRVKLLCAESFERVLFCIKRVPHWGIWQTDFQKVILPRGSNVTFISPFIPRSQHRPQKCSDLHHWEYDPRLAYNPFTLPIVSNGAMSIVKIIKPMLIQWFTSIFPPLASNNKIMWEVSQSISVHVQFICSRLHSPDTGYLQVSESQI